MKKLLIFLLVFPSVAWAMDCDRAKLSYLLESVTAQEDIYAVQFTLDLGTNPNGVTQEVSIKCFGGVPTSEPVMHAAFQEDTKILELLLKNGASPNAGCCEVTALQVAEENKNPKAAKLLKDYGAK